MPNCYFCGGHINSGQGYRRKVMTSESTRVYFSKRGGGSYGQTYSLRTLCTVCVVQLDERNKQLSWQLPLSVLAGLFGSVMAIRWAVADQSKISGFGSLIYAFILFGGLGVIIFIIGYLTNLRKKEAYVGSSFNKSEFENIHKYSLEDKFENAGQNNLFKYKESLMQCAADLADIGISAQGIYGLPQTLEAWISLSDKLLESIPPEQYSSKAEWEKHLEKKIHSKFYSLATSQDKNAKQLAFPRLYEESDEDYQERFDFVIKLSSQKIVDGMGY